MTASSKLKGKIMPSETEVVPTPPKGHMAPAGLSPPPAGRAAGSDEVSGQGLWRGIGPACCRSNEEADKLLYLAWYWLGTDGE